MEAYKSESDDSSSEEEIIVLKPRKMLSSCEEHHQSQHINPNNYSYANHRGLTNPYLSTRPDSFALKPKIMNSPPQKRKLDVIPVPNKKRRVSAPKKKVQFIDLTLEKSHTDWNLGQTVEVKIAGIWTSGKIISKSLDQMTVKLNISGNALKKLPYDSEQVRPAVFQLPQIRVKNEKVKREKPSVSIPIQASGVANIQRSAPGREMPLIAIGPRSLANAKRSAPSRPIPARSAPPRSAPLANSNGIAHIIFVIDNSKSMEERDVNGGKENMKKENIKKKKDRHKKGSAAVLKQTRSAAAFKCIETFVQNQKLSQVADKDLYSLVIFADDAWIEFQGEVLGDNSLIGNIKRVAKKTKPKFGTGIDTGLLEAFSAADIIHRSHKIDKTIVILLSDGAPRNRKYIKIVQKRRRKDKSLELHTVGIGECDHTKLKALAELGNGQFYSSELKIQEMKQVFTTIATTLTTMRTGVVLPPPKRALKLEQPDAYLEHETRGWKTCQANYMDNETMNWGPKCAEFPIKIRNEPFGAGSLRYAYILEMDGKIYVAKESKYQEKYKDRIEYHKENVEQQLIARDWAARFNKSLKMAGHFVNKINFKRAYIVRLRDENSKGGFRYVQVERLIEGKFEKFNNNGGQIPTSAYTSEEGKFANAFAHYTYEQSKQDLMILDIQGVGTKWTDPQVISKEKKYGNADLGKKAMDNFFKFHKCGDICSLLKLQDRSIGIPTRMPCLEVETVVRMHGKDPRGKKN